MPEGERKTREIVTPEAGPKPTVFEFKDQADAEEYLAWKQEVPQSVRRLVEGAMKDMVPAQSESGLTRTDQFLNTLGESFRERKLADLAGVDPKVGKFLAPFSRVPTKGGYINVFEMLTNPDVSWNLKRKIYDTQIRIALEWLINRDLEDIAEEAEKGKKQPTPPSETGKGPKPPEDVPSASEEARSSMESGVEKGEGPPTPLFSVKPFFGGYYEQLVFNNFDVGSGRWTKEKNEFSDPAPESYDITSARVFFGKVRGGEPLALPLPDDWTFDVQSLETDAPEGKAELLQNQDGRWHLRINKKGVFQYRVRGGRLLRLRETEGFRDSAMTGELPAELTAKIEELKKQRLPKMKLKREIVKLIRNALTYSNSPDAYRYYREKPDEYFKRIWERKEADCKVANDLACRALVEVDPDFQYVAGFYVKEKTPEGDAIMHAGNGHAWLKIWDAASRRPIRLDATPKGDPTINEEEQERDLEGGTGEGDYGASEEELASEAETKKQMKELQKKGGGGSGKEKPVYDLEEERFAELAECTPAQAKEFLDALDRVREIKDEQGMPISDLMKDEWRKIVEERKVQMHEYQGPVRMDEGDRLLDPARAMIDIRSREYNPSGFEKDERIEKTQTDFGGVNIYFSFDLSGSMAGPDGATGRIKADVQRDVVLLFVDSLMQCAYMNRQAGEESDLLPLKIMVTLASDRGEVKLHLTDKWGPKEQWALYLALTQLARGGTPTHQTLQLIEKDFNKELEELRKKNLPPEKMPIQYTAEISDGVPDDFDATEAMHKKLKKKGMVMRSYVIGGTSSSEDAAPPLQSFSELPKILAKDIITQFKKLHPRKIVQ